MLLKVKDLAAWLNMPQSTVYLWAAQSKIPCRKIHGLIRFDWDEILHWLASFATKRSNPICHIQDCSPGIPVNDLIARATLEAYTPAHGETKTPSTTGKE